MKKLKFVYIVLAILSSCAPNPDDGKSHESVQNQDSVPIISEKQNESFTDERDGKTYNIVKIGSQTWMAENLAYLPEVSDLVKDGGFWVYGYNGNSIAEAKQSDHFKTYGVLYSWKAAKESCPAGWRLPDEKDWQELIDFLGGNSEAKKKLKRTGTEFWTNPNQEDTNESGFSALPAGVRYPGTDPQFRSIGNSANFWSKTVKGSNVAYALVLGYNSCAIGLDGLNSGFSVRCIKMDSE